MTTDTTLTEGTAAAMATAMLLGDAEALDAIAATLPPLPLALEDAAGLFHDSAVYSLGVWLGREATAQEAAMFWATDRQQIVENLVYEHDMTMDGVDAVSVWLAVILAAPEQAWVPASMPCLHLALALGCAAEMFRAWPERWSEFLAARAAWRIARGAYG